LWIHHWVILKFDRPLFSVDVVQKLDELNPDGTLVFNFKHDNWNQFVSSMDEEMLGKLNVIRLIPILGWYGLAIILFKVTSD
jgi:hypothetical protein